LSLAYEVNVNTNTTKTIDFNFITENHVTVNFELVRPDLNKGIRDKLSGDVLQGYILTSDHADPDFRTCAQQIKLQWALLEKVGKFSNYSKSTINIIVVDCSNVHHGMFDHHDLGMAMYGYPGNPIWQEYWEGNKLIGMWEAGYEQRGSDDFCERISAVIFVSQLQERVLANALAALNPLITREHKMLVFNSLQNCQAFVDMNLVY